MQWKNYKHFDGILVLYTSLRIFVSSWGVGTVSRTRQIPYKLTFPVVRPGVRPTPESLFPLLSDCWCSLLSMNPSGWTGTPSGHTKPLNGNSPNRQRKVVTSNTLSLKVI